MKWHVTFILIWLIPLRAIGQTLSGIVIDKNSQPIPEVTILHSKTDRHSHTDEQGRFLFEGISVGDTLQFIHLSFKTKRIIVKDIKDLLTVVLESNTIDLGEVIIAPRLNALHLITDIDIQANPVNSSQDVLRKVPGLFIGQHAGGGKAEQIFLRGFDIDHGTDISITVDGQPVNMVSHAHGQGYADLHFVIPETIQSIDFGKGPYYQEKGNFTTAGYVDFSTKSKLEQSSITLEGGQFNTFRLLGMFNLLEDYKHNAYIASEFLGTDGPFESPQNFNRINLFGKYTGFISKSDKIGVTISHFTSSWDASGQIPQRAVDAGIITRFGAIDDTEGGSTSRTNLLLNHHKTIDEKSSISSFVFLNSYDFELYSNFTFFLDDPLNGDQIRQKENRTLFGLNSAYSRSFSSGNLNGKWEAGIHLRNDQSENNELSQTKNRLETRNRLQFGDINETNFGVFWGTTLTYKKWIFNPSIRFDYFDFQYYNKLASNYRTEKQTKAIISPKLNILFNPNENLQLYLKTGKGFHSNDTRVVIQQNGDKILPAAYGADLGYLWKPTPKMLLNMALWYLYSEQEFVYVGDAGIVEPSGKSRRQGIDLSYRYQPLSWLFWNLDANYAHARAIEERVGQDYIPLAPAYTLSSGLNFNFSKGFYGGISLRHMADRPANEDNSIIAEGYTITDLNAGFKSKNLNFGIQIQNLFNQSWNETQFATESRLRNEPQPVEEIHFTPGTPFFMRARIQYNF